MDIIDEIRSLIEDHGGELYGGEPITQAEHAIQCAALAETSGSGCHMIAAALLHDIGHLLDERFEAALDERIDLHHEDAGADYLKAWFGPEVTEPVRLHVHAKRYLCAVEPAYHDTLSPASRHTLELQGGPFSSDEAVQFGERDHAKAAVQLRRWDDLGKDPEMMTEPLDHYLELVRQALHPSAR